MQALTEWADARLAARGVSRTGDIELNRERPWSTTWHAPTELGTVWLKRCSELGRYEAGLTALLARVAPEWTLQPLGVEADRGWLLLPDGGPELGAVFGSGPVDVITGVWTTLLTEYAALQRRMVEFVPEALAIGVPDLRASQAPAVFDRLVREHTDGHLRQRLLDSAARFAEGCERLAASDVPVSLQHDDLHAGAAFCGADGLGAPAFFDWGDAMVSHPFATLVVSRQVLALTLEVDTSDAAVERVVDAYLTQWRDVAPLETLRAEFTDVAQLGRLGRAWSWQRALAGAAPEQVREWGDPVAWWLEQLL